MWFCIETILVECFATLLKFVSNLLQCALRDGFEILPIFPAYRLLYREFWVLFTFQSGSNEDVRSSYLAFITILLFLHLILWYYICKMQSHWHFITLSLAHNISFTIVLILCAFLIIHRSDLPFIFLVVTFGAIA